MAEEEKISIEEKYGPKAISWRISNGILSLSACHM